MIQLFATSVKIVFLDFFFFFNFVISFLWKYPKMLNSFDFVAAI